MPVTTDQELKDQVCRQFGFTSEQFEQYKLIGQRLRPIKEILQETHKEIRNPKVNYKPHREAIFSLLMSFMGGSETSEEILISSCVTAYFGGAECGEYACLAMKKFLSKSLELSLQLIIVTNASGGGNHSFLLFGLEESFAVKFQGKERVSGQQLFSAMTELPDDIIFVDPMNEDFCAPKANQVTLPSSYNGELTVSSDTG
jgi:hypothetical protein